MLTDRLIDQLQQDRAAGLRRHARRRSFPEPTKRRAGASVTGEDCILTDDGVIYLDREPADTRS